MNHADHAKWVMRQGIQALRGHKDGPRILHIFREVYEGKSHIRLLCAAAYREPDVLYETLDEMVVLEKLLACDRDLLRSEMEASLERLWING